MIRQSRSAALAAVLIMLVLPSDLAAKARKKKPQQTEAAKPAEKVVFPPPPVEPVIEWTGSYHKRSEVAPENPRKKRLRRILVGEEISQRQGPTLLAPTAVAIGPDETVYVVDQQLNTLFLINPREGRFDLFAGAGTGRLANPVGAAVADDGTLYVTDSSSRSVFVYGPALAYRKAFGGPDVFERPTGIAVSPDGKRLAVCDTPRHRVLILDSITGEVLNTFGGDGPGKENGEFHFPWTAAYDAEGFLYITDYLNYRVQVFDPAGDHNLSFGEVGDRPGNMARPRGIAVDTDGGIIYVVDGAYQLVQMFNLDGEMLMYFGSPGYGPAQFSLPSGIALRGDLLAVADTLNHRVQLFRFLGAPSAGAD